MGTKIKIDWVRITKELLAKEMKLPDYVEIAGFSQDNMTGELIIILASCDKSLCNDNHYLSFNKLKEIGEGFVNPEKFIRSSKGTMRASNPRLDED